MIKKAKENNKDRLPCCAGKGVFYGGHTETPTQTPGCPDYSQFSKLLPYQIRIMQAKVGRRGLEPPETEAT